MRQDYSGGGGVICGWTKNKYALSDGKQTYLNHIVFSGLNLIKSSISDGQVNYEHLFWVLKSRAETSKREKKSKYKKKCERGRHSGNRHYYNVLVFKWWCPFVTAHICRCQNNYPSKKFCVRLPRFDLITSLKCHANAIYRQNFGSFRIKVAKMWFKTSSQHQPNVIWWTTQNNEFLIFSLIRCWIFFSLSKITF